MHLTGPNRHCGFLESKVETVSYPETTQLAGSSTDTCSLCRQELNMLSPPPHGADVSAWAACSL